MRNKNLFPHSDGMRRYRIQDGQRVYEDPEVAKVREIGAETVRQKIRKEIAEAHLAVTPNEYIKRNFDPYELAELDAEQQDARIREKIAGDVKANPDLLSRAPEAEALRFRIEDVRTMSQSQIQENWEDVKKTLAAQGKK